ncbi:MAG: ferritin family protein [Euryarchaeota archaeon]|nr:ferritin family protein [Euryarchaeota archaeon]
MDLHKYSLEDVYLSAIKAEIESEELYDGLAARVRNAFLREKLEYLAAEEEKHRAAVERMHAKEFPEKELALPSKSPVPLPRVGKPEGRKLSEVFEMAMEAEKAASEFYTAFAELFPNDRPKRLALQYFATMEMGHYKLIEIEKDNALKFENFDDYWPMMHAGP